MSAVLPATRADLYAALGLVDAPLPAHVCGGCPTCRDIETGPPPSSYEHARRVAEGRLQTFAVERVLAYADARVRAEKAGRERQRNDGYRTPVLAWTREAR